MESEDRDAVEFEIVSATRQVLRTLGRIGAATGDRRAANLAEILCDLVDQAVAAGKRSDFGEEETSRAEYAVVEPEWLSPPDYEG